MTEESNGAAVALPATDYTLAIPARPYEPAYVTNEEGFSAEAMLAFRAEGEATLRAQLTASEASRKELREALEHIETLSSKLRHGGPDASDLQDLSDALQEATDVAHEALANDAEQKGVPDTQAEGK